MTDEHVRAAAGRAWVVGVVVAALAGCGTGELCDPDQRYLQGVCYALDAPPATADANARFTHFGDVCSEDPDCAAPATYCARQPAAPTGYCTGTGCLGDATACPAGWSCTDLSVFQAGLPAICTQP